MKTMIAIGVAMLVAACVSTGEIDGHRIRGTAAPPVEQPMVANDLHQDAPAWFIDGWHRYLDDADGRYAVLAVDRNGRGWGYVYCASGGCQTLDGAQNKSWKDLKYHHGALDFCRKNVRENFPAYKPNCAIYAIKDKIVWEGRFPWE